AGMLALSKNNGRSNLFSQARVGHRKHASAVHGGMFCEDRLDFQGRYLFAATVNQVLDPASNFQIAIFVEPAQIAGAKPVADESCRCRLRIIPIAVEDGWTARDNLSFLIGPEKRSITVDDLDLVNTRNANF